MELFLKREEQPTKTFGKLYKVDQYLCETLEDRVRGEGEKFVSGETAIPYGRYRLIVSYSNRFKKQMIQVVNVRGGHILFHGVPIDATGIRFHGGNSEKDTLGCVLCGKIRNENGISDCFAVNQMLIDMVKKADETEEVYLNIVSNK